MRLNLQKSRTELGLTQAQMADRLEITVRQYQRIESGEQDGTLKLWERIKALTGKPLDYLVERFD